MKRVTWFVFFSIITVSCLDEPDCFQINNDVIVIAFKIFGGANDAISVTNVKTPAAADVTFNDDTIAPSFALPLNPLVRNINYIFNIKSDYRTAATSDSLQIGYNRQVQFVSEDCGERDIYSSLSVSSHSFDSVRVVNGTPTTNPSVNIEVYRCPRTNIMGLTFASQVNVKTITPDYDSLVYDIGGTFSTIDLPLDTLRTSTSFVFAYADGTSRTLSVTYRLTPKVVTRFCGQQRFLGNLKYDVAKTTYSTVTIPEDSIMDLPVSNIAITP